MVPSQPCSEPTAFPGAAVNVVVLPYRYSGHTATGLRRTAEKLSLLVQLETFFSLIKYGSVGSVRLVEDADLPEGCEPERVLAQLVGEQDGAVQQVAPGKGLVLLWGLIYEERDDIYVQTYARFLRRGTAEELELRVRDRRITGKLPFQAVAFGPRRLTSADLEAIEREFAASAMVHDEPNEVSAARPLPLDPRRPLAYGAVDVRGGWIRVESFGGGPSGWIRASLDRTQWPLRRKLSELGFIEGVAGYLRYRAGELAPAQTANWAVAALSSYGEQGDAATEPTALATSRLLTGLLSILQSGETAAGLLRAQQEFERASALVPYSADVRNLSLLARIDLAYKAGQTGLRSRQVADEFLQAASLEPQNRLLLDNLESFYRLLGTAGPPAGADPSSALKPEELQERLLFLEGIRRPGGD